MFQDTKRGNQNQNTERWRIKYIKCLLKTIFQTVTCKCWASGPTPPPNPPSWPSTLIKRVLICLEFKHLAAYTVLMPSNLIPAELYAKNWYAHALALITCLVHKSSQKYLPRHFFSSFMQLMHNAIRELQVWNQLLVISLNIFPRPTWWHSMHFCDQAPRPPPLLKLPNNGANWTGLSWGTQNIFNISWKWPSRIMEHSFKIPRPPPQYVVYISFDTPPKSSDTYRLLQGRG